MTHVDGSARVQTVHAETNPVYHALLRAFEARTGCPVLVNTSFNVRGEPIVCTPADAYRCFMRTDIDHLVIGSFVLDKGAQPPWHEAPDAWRVGDGARLMTTSHGPKAPATRRELRGFAWSVGGVFLVLAGVAAWRERTVPAIVWGGLGGALWLAGALVPMRLAGVHRVWMRGALAISAVTTPILMGVVYFGVLTPMALVARLAGRRALGVRPDAPTAWVERPPDARRSDLRRQF